ncbi:hypothetical protein M5D96_012382, partial [Drosophila gunungcola]
MRRPTCARQQRCVTRRRANFFQIFFQCVCMWLVCKLEMTKWFASKWRNRQKQ